MATIEVNPSILPAIFVDLDGTILNDDGQVDEKSALLLSELAAMEVRVVVATARSPQGALEVIEGLAFDPICVTLNGALVIDTRNDEIVYESILPTYNYQRIVSTVEEASLGGSYLALQHRNSFITEAGFMDNCNFVIPHTIGEVRNYSESASKLILRTDNYDSSELHHIFGERLSSHSYMSTSGDEWLDFSPTNVSKATGAHQVANYYGFSVSSCVAIGNDLNDVDLLRSVGFGFAVANARSRILDDPSILKLTSDNNSIPLLEVIKRCSSLN